MAFDLTTAIEDKEYKGGFDLSTATHDDQNNGAVISAYKAPTVIERVKNAWEWTTQVPVAAFQEQHKNNEAAALRTKGIYLRKIGKDLSEQEKARIKELDNPYQQGKYNELNNYGIYSRFKQTDDGEYFDKGSPAVFAERMANGVKRLYADAMKQTAIFYSMIKDMSIGGVAGGVLGLGAGAIATKTPQGAVAGAKTGASLLARSAVAKKSFELEAGFMRQELEILNSEIAADVPLSDQEMDNLSIAVGTINASLEYVGLGAVLKTVPNGDKILGKLGKDGIKELAQDKAFREQFTQLGIKLAEAGITEGSTEAIQEYTNFVYSNLARKMKGVAPQPLAEKIDDIMYSGLVGSVCAITMGGVGTAAQAASIKVKQGIDAKTAQKEAEAMTIDERNEFINENIETLAEVATEQADNSLNALQGQVTYNRIKEEMERQGATSEIADNSAQLVQQAYNVIADKFGSEGKELLEKSNLQILINQNNKNQVRRETQFVEETDDETLKKRETQTFKPSELLTDAKTFQYKENSDQDGVTDRLQGVEKFDPLYAGKIIVYETIDGKRYIVDGHQRLGLAKRLGGDNIELEGFLFKEADGYTPEQMRLLAAQKNIAEGSGTAIDTAKIIREIGLENLPKTIPTNSVMVKNGMSLSKLGDTAFQKVVNGEIETNEAAVVADILRNDESKQVAAIDSIRKDKFKQKPRLKNLNQIAIFCNDIAAADLREFTQTNLFGDFTTFETLAIEKSEIVDKAMKSLINDKKIFSGLLRNDSKIKGRGKNRLDKQTNARIAQEADLAIELIQKLVSKQGIIADKANELAGLVKDEKISMEEATKEFKAFVLQKDIINDIWGKAKKEISYNQAAIGNKISTDRNIYAALEEINESEEGIITPEEFYRKGLYQSANLEDLSNWQSKYPDIAEALAEQERLKREGLLPPTIEINTLERTELRKDIAEDLYGKGAKNKNKQAYLIIGSPASGKSSMADPLQVETGSLIIDSDMAKERLPEFIESNGARADQVHLESQKIAEIVLNKAVENGDNVILPIVGKSEKSIMKKYDRLKAAGYDVHLRLVYLPMEVTVDRAVNRFRETGRLVPIDYIINEVGYNPAQNYVIMKEKGLFKSYEAISTEVEYGQKPKQITAEEVANELQSRGLRLFKDEVQGRNKLVQRSSGGRIGNGINGGNPRGVFRVDENGTAIIDILENGDASTVVHELGHFYLYSLETLAETNTRAAKELEEVNKWLGKDTTKQYTENEIREFHEKFARGFEAYLLEGSAPTKGLLRVFHNFKSWLRDIYNSAKDLNVEFSEATQMLFDRVFTTDEEYEKQVLPKYQYNYAKAIELDAITSSPHYKFKKGLKEFGEKFSLWYDKLFIPIETRIGKISPALRDKLRSHTAELALIKGKDLNIAANFFRKTEEMKKNNYEDYLTFDLALKNRDEHLVKIIANRNGLTAELAAVQDLLDDIYNEALAVGLDVGYLENYYPRLVKADLTEKFIEYIESLANQERLDVINQVIKLEDAKISIILKDLADADPNGFWGLEDKAKFINNRIRGFGKNNILLSRNASLKFERQIDELDGNFNQFYETLEPALVGYISKTRDVIEARKFFGNEIKEVGKLRARIKRKKKTLDEVEQRKPNQAKYKEIQRLKYELSPIEIKLEQLEKRSKELENRGEELWEEQAKLKEGLEKKAKNLRNQIEFVEKMHPVSAKNMVKKRLKSEISEAAEEIKKLIGDETNVEDSIGALITSLSQKGDIYYKDERLIREMLLARFNASTVCEPVRMIRDLSYIGTLNDITNALTQFGDLAFSVYKYGFEDTFKGLKKPFEISKEDLGLNDMAYEFASPSALSKWLKKQFDIIGLSAIDGLGKNAIIQASLLNAQKKAKKGSKEFIEKLKNIYGNNAEAIRKDLAEGNITDDTIIYAFHELSDVQPISENQVTELYLSGGSFMKLFYTLKTYGIKALDIARTDITNNIIQGVKNKNKGQVKKGLQNLIRLQMLLWLFGVPIDALKDLLSNRDFNLFETMIDTLIPSFLVNRYIFRTGGKEGVGAAVVDFFTPSVVNLVESTGKSYGISHIPLIGKPLYNWFIKDK